MSELQKDTVENIPAYAWEKDALDDKIEAMRFTYVASKKQYYDEQTWNLDRDNAKLELGIAECLDWKDRIFEIDDDESVIEKTLNKMASDLMKIDEKRPNFDGMIINPVQAVDHEEEKKEQKELFWSDEDSNSQHMKNFYFIQDGDVFKTSVKDGRPAK